MDSPEKELPKNAFSDLYGAKIIPGQPLKVMPIEELIEKYPTTYKAIPFMGASPGIPEAITTGLIAQSLTESCKPKNSNRWKKDYQVFEDAFVQQWAAEGRVLRIAQLKAAIALQDAKTRIARIRRNLARAIALW